MKAGSGGSLDEPGKEPGSVQQEARSCPVCGTKFFASTDSDFCPVCILRGATGGESATTGEPGSVCGSADSPGETQDGSQARRFEHYELMLDETGARSSWGVGRWASPTRHSTSICAAP